MNFCTLFDSNYLSRGLAMYSSLRRNTPSFHLYILAFDQDCYYILQQLNLASVTVIGMSDFEDADLLAVKPGRSRAEYCWTSTPSLIRYCLDIFNLESCTYLDADLFFFGDPIVLIEEMGCNSVLITEHDYTPEYDQSATSGVYCVQFMTFKNSIQGRIVLDWWRAACLEWCYARFENGKFGDQKYLDDWPDRFAGVHVLKHRGILAPWNVQKYRLRMDGQNHLIAENLKDGSTYDVVFYHFHNFRLLQGERVDLGVYRLTANVIDFIYSPFVKEVLQQGTLLNRIRPGRDFHATQLTMRRTTISPDTGVLKRVWFGIRRVLASLRAPLKRRIKGTYNVFPIDRVLGSKWPS